MPKKSIFQGLDEGEIEVALAVINKNKEDDIVILRLPRTHQDAAMASIGLIGSYDEEGVEFEVNGEKVEMDMIQGIRTLLDLLHHIYANHNEDEKENEPTEEEVTDFDFYDGSGTLN